MDGREFPSVGGKEEVDGMVVEVGFGAQVRIDHLSDCCRAVCVVRHANEVTCDHRDRDTTIVVQRRW